MKIAKMKIIKQERNKQSTNPSKEIWYENFVESFDKKFSPICLFDLPKHQHTKERHYRNSHNLTIEEFELVANDSELMSEYRDLYGFTDVRGQCLYCSKVCKNLGAFITHRNNCKPKKPPAKGPTEQREKTKSVVFGGVISDDESDTLEIEVRT